jgi:nucleotide-binding universal stress UspA family protein
MDATQYRDGRTEQLGVVVGVDGSSIALDAVRWATAEARLRGLPLRILHAAPYAAGTLAPPVRRARDILARAFTVAHRAEPGVPATTRRTDEDAVPSLLDAAQRAHLLVVGMGGGDRPQELLVGSVALDVSGRATCPVAVVRGLRRAPALGPVLVGVDDPATDTAALTVAFSDARRHGGRVVVLHVRYTAASLGEHLAGHAEAARIAAWDELADALAPWAARFPDVPVELQIMHGLPTPALLAAAVHARLVVVGTRRRGAPARVLFGSTSRAVLRRSPVPVVVVNPDIVLPDEEPSTVPAAPAASAGAAIADPHDRSELW